MISSSSSEELLRKYEQGKCQGMRRERTAMRSGKRKKEGSVNLKKEGAERKERLLPMRSAGRLESDGGVGGYG